MKDGKKWSFDIDRAIDTWRQFMSRNPAIRPIDLEELEIHLRDEWESLISRGIEPEKAFDEARRDLGDISELSASYKGVHFEKVFRKGQARTETHVIKTVLGNYLKTAWRSLIRQKAYSTINILGLGLALSAALVISLFIRHSLSYDQYLDRVDDTYRVVMDRDFPGENSNQSSVTVGLAELIRAEWSGAESVTQMYGRNVAEVLLTVDQVHFQMTGVLQVDEYFTDVFPLSFVDGNGPASLQLPRSMVLTESTAMLLFGTDDAIGKTVRLDATTDYTVTAIVSDPPTNTHLPFQVLVRGFVEPAQLSWNSIGSFVYVVLPDPQKASELSDYLTHRFSKENPGAIGSFSLQPVRDIHLNSGVMDDYAQQSDSRYLLIFASIGLLMLVIACINYVNMATARADKRIREIGVRKVIGASKGQLKVQFLLESLLTTLLSVPVALLIAAVALPHISNLLGESLEFSQLFDPMILLVVLSLILLVSQAAGFYPATLMARKRPVEVFAGSRSFGGTRITLRQVLVGVQVSIAFALIAITLLISGQLEFIQTNRLGFDTDTIVTLSPQDWSEEQFASFQSEVTSHSAVQSAATGLPLGLGYMYFAWTQTLPEDGSSVEFASVPVGIGFVETMGLEVIEGRSFNEIDLSSDTPPVIVSRSYADLLGRGASVVGSEMTSGNGGRIIGVVDEFRNTSFKDNNKVTVLRFNPEMTRNAVVKLSGGQISDGLIVLEAAWKAISPDRPMKYHFLDDRIQAQYEAEIKFGSMFNVFSGLSIIIATLGLFGLAALTARQRDKEIAIRKSQGASEMNILLLLMKDLSVTFIAGIAVAIPLVWIYGNKWLAEFNEHVLLDASILLQSAMICLAFVVVAVVLQSLRAARANPVVALSWE